MSAFCAICARDIVGEPLRRPLGRDDALVNVCHACDEGSPRAGRYSFGGGKDPCRGLLISSGTQWRSAKHNRGER